MKHLLMCMLLALAVVVALGESAARAELVDFSYQWAALPSSVSSMGDTVSLTPFPKGTGEYDTSNPQTQFIKGLAITSNASSTTATFPDPGMPAGSANFQLQLSLTDAASNQSGTLTFGGSVSGSLSATSSTATTTFTNLTQTLLLGSHLYSVSLDPFSTVPIPGATGTGFVSAGVTASSVNGPPGGGGPTPPPVTNTPEPSSLVLGGMGLAGLVARRWSRLKRQPV